MNAPVSREEWERQRREAMDAIPELVEEAGLPSVLLPYQAKAVRLLDSVSETAVLVIEKSRRIGLTWALAAYAVLRAARRKSADGMDAMYISYSQEMTREFIDACAMWARAFNEAAGEIEDTIFADRDETGDKSIQAFRIRFASGFEILALSSAPRSLRGKQGVVIIDEAAFVDNVEELLKAALAFLMWGGQVIVCSTHDGDDNPFNRMVQDVLSGKLPYTHLKIDLDQALRDGLYQRICLVRGTEWSPEAEANWRQNLVDFYGDGADEELFCIPRRGSGAYISGASVEACMTDAHHVARLTCPPGFELRAADERRAYVQSFLDNEVAPHLKRFDPERLSALGEDFGRSSDLTVLTVGQERADLTVVVPLVVELRNMPIEQQFQVICFICDHLPRFVAGKFDATGNGLGLAERAQERYGYDRIEAVKLSQGEYLEHGPRLKQHFEDRTIELPRDSDVKDDMRAVKLVRGIPTIPDTRKKGRHGDAFVSLMLLCSALKMEYQEHSYDAVPRGGRAGDDGRRVSVTAGFNAREGIW